MSEEPFRQHLKAARPFGCLPACLFALGMGFVVFVGSIMGDCEPGPGCHDHDGRIILNGFIWVLLIAVTAGAAAWLVSGVLRMIARPAIGPLATNVAPTALMLLLVWFGFKPAMELWFTITAPAAP